MSFKHAGFGSVSTGTLQTDDLLQAFAEELRYHLQCNATFYAMPENKAETDSLKGIYNDAFQLLSTDADDWSDDHQDLGDEIGERKPTGCIANIRAGACLFRCLPRRRSRLWILD